MKKKILLIIGFLVLVIFLIIGTYSWYLFFLKTGRDYYINSKNGARIGDLVLIDDGKTVYDTDAKSLDDENILSVIPYTFKISNLGNKEKTYVLYLEDLPVGSINDGCSSKTLLKRSQLKYQLKLNNEIIKEDYLSNLEDNILDKRNIDGKDTNTYELRIYIHDVNDDWYNKHYHYRVVLKKVM